MADSDNSISVPDVTRRALLSGMTLTVGAIPFSPPLSSKDMTATSIPGFNDAGSASAGASNNEAFQQSGDTDPTVRLLRQWKKAARSAERACRRQQQLETEMIKRAGGFAIVTINLPDTIAPVHARTIAELSAIFANRPQDDALHDQCRADLAAKLSQWNAADRSVGYTRALRAEAAATKHADRLLDQLLDAKATSLPGIIAKLTAIIKYGEPCPASTEFPWPQLRKIIKDTKYDP